MNFPLVCLCSSIEQRTRFEPQRTRSENGFQKKSGKVVAKTGLRSSFVIHIQSYFILGSAIIHILKVPIISK